MFYFYLDNPYGTELIGQSEDYETVKKIKKEKDKQWKQGYLWQTRITEAKEKEFAYFD